MIKFYRITLIYISILILLTIPFGINYTGTPISQEDNVLILINEKLYPKVSKKLDRYIVDVEEKFPVDLILVKVNITKPEEIRSLLQQEYYTNHISGAILVGEIPFVLWKQGFGDNKGILSLFYEDLDGKFEDRDNDGFYDYHIFGENNGPEIWVCWMRPPIFAQSFYLNRFLDKTHLYYTGEIKIEDKAFVACHEDYDNNFYGLVGVVPILEEIYGTVDKDGEGRDLTIAREIWYRLSNSRYKVFDTWQHASSTYQTWDKGGFNSLQIFLLLRKGPLITFIYGCHSADFWTAPGDNIFNINTAVSYVFGSSIGEASSGTSWSYGTEYKYLIYESLRNHSYLGEAWFNMESYIETQGFIENRYPDRDPHMECAGNNLIGNPFLYA